MCKILDSLFNHPDLLPPTVKTARLLRGLEIAWRKYHVLEEWTLNSIYPIACTECMPRACFLKESTHLPIVHNFLDTSSVMNTWPLPYYTTDCSLKLFAASPTLSSQARLGQISSRPQAKDPCGLCTVASLHEDHTQAVVSILLWITQVLMRSLPTWRRTETAYLLQTSMTVCAKQLDRRQASAPQRGQKGGPALRTWGYRMWH